MAGVQHQTQDTRGGPSAPGPSKSAIFIDRIPPSTIFSQPLSTSTNCYWKQAPGPPDSSPTAAVQVQQSPPGRRRSSTSTTSWRRAAYEHAEKVLDRFPACHVVVTPHVQDAQFDGCRTNLGERASGFEIFEHIKLDSTTDTADEESVELDVIVFDSGRASSRCVDTSDPPSIPKLTFRIV